MLAEILTRAAARFGNKPALVTDTRTLSYAELDALSDRVAAELAARAIAPRLWRTRCHRSECHPPLLPRSRPSIHLGDNRSSQGRHAEPPRGVPQLRADRHHARPHRS